MGHALMENRNGLIVGAVTTTASGAAERWAALTLIEPRADTPQPVTLGSDKGYDSADFVAALRDKAVTPHVAQHTSGRRSAVDEATAGHPGYAISQRIGKRVEEAFGWAKMVAGFARCGTVDCSRSIGNSPSRWPPMTSSVCPNCSPRPSREPLTHNAAHRGSPAPDPTCRKTPPPLTCRSSWKPEPVTVGIFSAPCSHVRFQGLGAQFFVSAAAEGVG